MSKCVLDVGNCGFDHGSIRSLIEANFSATVKQVHSRQEALDALQQQQFDLVLVNRVFDLDGDSGHELIESIKQDAELASVPVMLITNFPDHQQRAVAVGATFGFGKQGINSPETLELLATILG